MVEQIFEYSFKTKAHIGIVRHDLTLMKKYRRLYVRKYAFSQTAIPNIWNTLSTDCLTTSSVNVFKNRTDKCIPIAVTPGIMHEGSR